MIKVLRPLAFTAAAILGLTLTGITPGAMLLAQNADNSPAEDDGGSYLETLIEESLSSPGRDVSITGFSGALSSTARLDSLSISDDDGVWLRLEQVELDWTRSALLQGRVEVNTLRADTLAWPRMPLPSDALPSPEAQPFALPELPVSIAIGTLAIKRAHIGAAVLGQDAVLSLNGALSLVDGTGDTELKVLRHDTVDGAFHLKAHYANATREAAIALTLKEGAGGLLSTALDLPGDPQVAFEINGAGPLSNFSATTRLASDGQERLRGTLILKNDEAVPERQTFQADLGGDLTPLFAPQYRDFFGPDLRLSLVGAQQGTQLDLERLELRSNAMTVTGAMQLQSGWPTLIALDGQIAAPQNTATKGAAGKETPQPVILPLGGTTPTQIDSLRFRLSHDSRISPDWQLDADITGLAQADLTLSKASIRGRGKMRARQQTPDPDNQASISDANRVQGHLTLRAEGITPKDPAIAQAIGPAITASTRFSASGDTALTLQDIQFSGTDYHLSGTVEFGRDTHQALAVKPDLTVQADDLARFARLLGQPLTGRAGLSINGALHPLSGGFDVQVNGRTTNLALGQAQLDTLLSGDAHLSLKAQRDHEGTRIQPLILRSDAAQITAQAILKSRGSTLNLRAEVTDVARLEPELRGAATLTLTARQSGRDDWQLQSDLTAPAGLQLSTQLDLSNASSPAPTVAGTATLAAADLALYRTLAALPVPLSGAIDLSLSGSAQPKQQLFRISAQLNSQDLAIANPQVDTIFAGRATLNIAAEKTQKTTPVFFRQIALNTPELTVALDGQGDTEKAEVRYRARLRDMAVLGAGISGALSSNGRATLADNRWQIDSQHQGPGGASLTTTGTLSDDFSTAALSVIGDVPLSLANPLIQPRNIQGFAHVDLRLDGPPGLAALSGQIKAQDARLSLPTLRQSIEDIAGTVGIANSRATLDLGARPALGGTVSLGGEMLLDASLRSDLSIALRDVVARDPSLYDTTLSGQVGITGPIGQGGGAIRGQIDLGATELHIPANSAPQFTSLPGLKHLNEPAAVRRLRGWAGLIEQPRRDRSSRPTTMALDVAVNAPAQIFVRGRGLDAELGGSLRIGGTTAQVIPQGQFDLIRGRLDVLGNRLTLTTGLVQLQGGFDPFVRFVAQTATEAVTAMITIEGEASAPKLTFTSVPALPEDEVLSLLLFRRELSRISPLQAVRLANAIRTLSGQGGEGLTGGVRRELALDNLDVTTSDDGTAEARVGKYINENIYTEITADTAGNSRIDLNLQISPSITARGRLGSDGNTGLGLFIERDY